MGAFFLGVLAVFVMAFGLSGDQGNVQLLLVQHFF